MYLDVNTRDMFSQLPAPNYKNKVNGPEISTIFGSLKHLAATSYRKCFNNCPCRFQLMALRPGSSGEGLGWLWGVQVWVPIRTRDFMYASPIHWRWKLGPSHALNHMQERVKLIIKIHTLGFFMLALTRWESLLEGNEPACPLVNPPVLPSTSIASSSKSSNVSSCLLNYRLHELIPTYWKRRYGWIYLKQKGTCLLVVDVFEPYQALV